MRAPLKILNEKLAASLNLSPPPTPCKVVQQATLPSSRPPPINVRRASYRPQLGLTPSPANCH
ncbi:uncharacterized protein BDZ83DRAFT_621292 [Colletotrichum acutatum]|uniref:Uncharacterized protein n=1 Tax=Glomerella acutata TaxID=27357 RepID=A0AAD8UNE0_GLOAC|nr:uncharacterized protein BDZ83DRAFT_621292 [Colletotrichum acutatum]KAK1724969.1 hypothetical protein BDZ83DRAFT_621292 [Colletotrichum acutatum]